MTEPSNASAERAILFGPFRLLPAQQLLLEGDSPVRVGSRALAVLNALVQRAGETVPKSELMAQVWPDIGRRCQSQGSYRQSPASGWQLLLEVNA